MMTITGLTRSFYGVAVLRGVDLSIPAGTITGLIGPNGAGKSTLFNLVTGAFPPDGGKVTFDGKDITARAPQDVVGRGLIRTFQMARGFPKMSVFQHLMLYGPCQPGESLWSALLAGPAARRREEALAERAWATARMLRLDHVVDNPVTALSGGQKKLVEIGRALMAEPKMILLDELARVYSNRPDEYAVAGRKPMGQTPWGDHVLKGRQPYLGTDMAGIRWAFFDHELIASMGLGSVINVPVVYDGTCLGTMNLLDAEHHYTADHVAPLMALAPLLIPAYLEARRNG